MPDGQLTLPDEIGRALHINEGDEVEFCTVHESADGMFAHLDALGAAAA